MILEDVASGRKLIEGRSADFDLLITNEPWLFEPFPEGLRVLYISGAPDREFLQRHRSPTFGYLQKPFRFQELLLSVHLLVQTSAEPCLSHHP